MSVSNAPSAVEAMPRLEKELDSLRQRLDEAVRERAVAVETEHGGRVGAEQAAAVALAKLDGAMDARRIVERALAETRQREQEREEEVTGLRQEVTSLREELKVARSFAVGGVRRRVPLGVPGSVKKKG